MMGRRMLALVIGGTVVPFLLVACGSEDVPQALSPTPQPPTGTILDDPSFVTPLRPDRGALQTVGPDGTGLQTLFETSDGLSFLVSPQADQVAVMTRSRTESVLYLIDPVTVERREVARRPDMSLGSWSADGRSLTLSIGLENDVRALGALFAATGDITVHAPSDPGYVNAVFSHFGAGASNSGAVFVELPERDVTSVLRLDATNDELTVVASTSGSFPGMAVSPDGTRLALGVLDLRPNQLGIYSIDVLQSDGSERSEVVRFSDEAPLLGGRGLAWSPDGSRLAYGRLGGSGSSLSQVFILNEDGESVQVTSGEDGIYGSLRWSPNQDALLVIRDICTTCDVLGRRVVLAPADGVGEIALPGAEVYGHADAAWAPDGERFVYSGDALYVAESDGSSSTPILQIDNASYGPIVWPTEDQMFFIRTSTRDPIMYVAQPDGSSVDQFSVGRNVPITGDPHTNWPWPEDGRMHELVWNAEGTAAALVLGYDDGSRLVIQDEAESRTLATHTFIERPTWSPDGRSIVYKAVNSLWVVDVDSGESRLLADDVRAGFAWFPGGEAVVASIDGRLIAVPTDGSMVEDLFSVPDLRYEQPQLKFSSDGSALAIGTERGLFIGELATGELVQATEHVVRGIAWSLDNQTLALGLRDTRGSGASSGVYLASRDGLELRQLTEPSGRLHDVQSWLPEGILFLSHTDFI